METTQGSPGSSAPAARHLPLAGLDLHAGGLSQVAADRLAALTARSADAASAMIHVADGSQLRLIGAHGLPPGFGRMQPVPVSSTLAGLVLHFSYPVVIADVLRDPRVPPDAPVRAVGLRSYAGFPVRDPDGEPVGVCAVAGYEPREWTPAELSAVDDAAQACTAFVAEQRGRQTAERQRMFLDTLLDSLDTGVGACDERGRLVLVNRSLRAILGIEPTDEPPEDWVPRLPVRHPDGRRVTVADVPMLHALRGEQVRDVERVVDVPGNRRRLYRVNAHPMRAADGRVVAAVSTFRDVTAQRRGERFRAAELAVVRALADAVSIEEAGGPVLSAVATSLGWPYAELWLVDPTTRTLRPAATFHAGGLSGLVPVPDKLDRGQGLAGAAWQRGEPVWLTDLDRLDHRPATGLHTALALPVASGTSTLAVLTLFADVVEDPQASLLALLTGIAAHIGQFLERRRAEDLQRALARSKDEYLNLVGHELRSPLTVIASYVDLIADADPAAPVTEILPMIDAVQRSSDRLRRLVEALLDLSALDSGHAPIRSMGTDLAVLVTDAVRDIQPAATAAGVTLGVDLPERLAMHGDPHRLTQLVTVLLDNAVTYTPRGGRVDVRLTATDTTADLQITDTGVGIPADERPHVFDRFYRGAVTRERAIPGAGLGLALARIIADRHHGRIDVAADERPGTTVCVRLPLHPAAEA